MAQEKEQVVEEIRLIWCEECADGPERYDHHAGFDDACEGGAETVKLCRERARKCIARVAKGPLPGEVGRLERGPKARRLVSGCGDCQEVSADLRRWIINQFNEGARTFIALRKEEEE